MASLQSQFTSEFFRQKGFDPEGMNSIILYDKGKFYRKSDAIIKIAASLDFPYCMIRFCAIIPHPLRDTAYQVVAGKRYKWFGKMDRCRLPDDETRSRIIG
jgi:predicted DCC family thiol-disulfide oxidoreductase YuxK